jgi:hypothetical protein
VKSAPPLDGQFWLMQGCGAIASWFTLTPGGSECIVAEAWLRLVWTLTQTRTTSWSGALANIMGLWCFLLQVTLNMVINFFR